MPAVSLVYREFPDVKMHWIVNDLWAPILRENPAVEETIRFPREQFRGLFGLMRSARWMKKHLGGLKPDLALDFQGLLRSGAMAKASGAELIIGMGDAREGSASFHDRTIPVPDTAVHAVDRYISLVEGLGVRREPGDPVEFPLPEGVAPSADALLPDHFILLHPFSRGEGKSMPPEPVMKSSSWKKRNNCWKTLGL